MSLTVSDDEREPEFDEVGQDGEVDQEFDEQMQSPWTTQSPDALHSSKKSFLHLMFFFFSDITKSRTDLPLAACVVASTPNQQ